MYLLNLTFYFQNRKVNSDLNYLKFFKFKKFVIFIYRYSILVMPSFKPKATKKIRHDKNSTITLDNKHKEIIEKFRVNEEEVITALKRKKAT